MKASESTNLKSTSTIIENMDRFLIESPHTTHNCKLAVKGVQSLGYLNNFEWGCKNGVHKGWGIIEVENANQALGVVPAFIRSEATAIQLNKFEPSMIELWGLHE